VVFIMCAMIRKRNRNCNSLARKFKSREEKCRRIAFWPRLQSRFSLGIASHLKDETKRTVSTTTICTRVNNNSNNVV
jgi:hypothetical protein